MKNKIILSLLSIVFLMACNEDQIEVEQPINEVEEFTIGNGLKVEKYPYFGKGKIEKGVSARLFDGGTDIAVFDTEANYENYIKTLESQVETWDDAFLAQWGHLSDDALDAKEEELNYNPEKPLTDFENQAGLSSLRQKYLAEENAWLNNEVLDEAADPDNNPIYNFDEEKMATLNFLAEVKIEGAIYKQLTTEEIAAVNEFAMQKGLHKRIEEGQEAMMVIDDGNYETLVDFNEGDMSVINDNNVTITQPSPAKCGYGKKIKKTFSISSDRKIKCKVKVAAPVSCNVYCGEVKGKIKSYKKKWYGWKRKRARMSAQIVGNIYYGSCGNIANPLNERKSKRKSRVTVRRINDSMSQAFFVESGGMKGVFTINGITKELVLTW